MGKIGWVRWFSLKSRNATRKSEIKIPRLKFFNIKPSKEKENMKNVMKKRYGIEILNLFKSKLLSGDV